MDFSDIWIERQPFRIRFCKIFHVELLTDYIFRLKKAMTTKQKFCKNFLEKISFDIIKNSR